MNANKEERPKLHIPIERLDVLLEALSAGLLIALVAGSISVKTQLPERIPMQFDFSGNPTRMGSKSEFILLPVVALFMWGMMTILSRYPHIFNYTKKVTAENAFGLYRAGVRFIRFIKMFVTGLFVALQWTVFQRSIGKEGVPEPFLLPLALGIPLAALVFYFLSQRTTAPGKNHG